MFLIKISGFIVRKNYTVMNGNASCSVSTITHDTTTDTTSSSGGDKGNQANISTSQQQGQGNQQQEEETTVSLENETENHDKQSHKENIWSYPKTPKQVMFDLLNLSEQEDITCLLNTLYGREDLFYVYLHFCVSNTITKTKWKHNKMNNSYYNYITVSDEAMTLLFLDNNAKRYLEMSDNILPGGRDGRTANLIQPKYTLVNGAKKFKGKGWNREGRMRYMKISIAIETWRECNQERMEQLAESIMLRYNNTILNGDTWDTRSDQTERRKKEEEDEKEWKTFLQNTSRKKQRVTGMVGV